MPTLLLVDDNDLGRDMLARRLTSRGFRVVEAGDGKQAFEQAVAERPAVIIMDMSLPVVDGWEATRRIRADHRTWTTPVIALTAHAMADDRQRCLGAGCDEFQTKPVDFQRLVATIHRLSSSPDPL
jgi:two-component system, cell cycle response regulator DivK